MSVIISDMTIESKQYWKGVCRELATRSSRCVPEMYLTKQMELGFRADVLGRLWTLGETRWPRLLCTLVLMCYPVGAVGTGTQCRGHERVIYAVSPKLRNYRRAWKLSSIHWVFSSGMADLTEAECGTQTDVRAVEEIQAETRAESLERYKQVYKYLAKGRYPRHLTALQKRSLRRYATKFEVQGKYEV